MKANYVATHTCVGIGSTGGFPLAHGNCFSVTADDHVYRIVNFCYENLQELVRRGLTWPIDIEPLEYGYAAAIHDQRIPDKWYQTRFCEVCTPQALLPQPQLLAIARAIARGDRIEHRCENGTTLIRITGRATTMPEFE